MIGLKLVIIVKENQEAKSSTTKLNQVIQREASGAVSK